MVELEILFASGQGILVPMEDRETALRFMQKALEHRPEDHIGMFHLSTPYEEILLDLADISFIRLKKENYPRIGATLKLPQYASHTETWQAEESHRQEHENAIKHRREAEQAGNSTRTFMVDPSGNINTQVTDAYAKAEERLRQAESTLDKIDAQRRKVEADLKASAEAIEDAANEAELKKKMEALEIDKEIKKMKDQHNG